MKQLDATAIARSKIAQGNRARLAQAMLRAQNGEAITIGFLGGSITEGYFSTTPDLNYASRVTKWWRDTFPNADVSIVNAGVGGTGSIIGVHRMNDHLLCRKPDVIVVEFAVNDLGKYAVPSRESYENVVRRCLKSGAAVLMLFTLNKEGKNVQDEQIEIGRHYDLPMISVKNAIWPPLANGERKWEDYSGDNVHPNDNGHAVVAALVTDYLDEVYAALDSLVETEMPLPEPLTSTDFEHACMLDHRTLKATVLGGFAPHERGFEHFHYAWAAENGGDAMVFTVEDCKVLHLLLKKDVADTAGTMHITVTANGEQSTFDFDAAFPGGWGGYAYPLLVHRSQAPQTVQVEIKPERSVMVMQVFKA